MYLISAYFDEETNRTLTRYRNMVADRTGNTFMMDNHVPPHITLASIEARSAEVLRAQFRFWEGQLVEGEVQFVSLGQLLPYVMYVTPVLNEYLMELSQTIFQAMSDIPETRMSKYYQPYSWLPHVTIGKKLDTEQMRIAFEVMQENFVPFHGTITEIGLAKVNPHEELERILL